MISPPTENKKEVIFLNERVSWLLDTRKDTIKIGKKNKNISIDFPVCKGLSIDEVGCQGTDTALQEIRPVELVLKPAVLLKKSWGGGGGLP